MKELIDQLKIEHEELMEMLTDISDLQIHKPQSNRMLMEIRDNITHHFEKEDQEIYSRIEESKISSEKIKDYLKTYSKEMESISQITMHFFKRLEEGKMKQSEYKAEIERIIFLLKARISWEESMFFLFHQEMNEDE